MSVYGYEFHALTIQAHLHTPPSDHILNFLAARGRSYENLSIPEIAEINLKVTPPPHSID